MSATPQDPSEYADRMLAALDTMYAENAPAATKRHLLKAVLTLFRDESLASRPEERTGTCQCDETGTAHSVCVKRGCQGSLAEPPRGGGEREAKIRPEYEVMDARQLFTVAAEWIRTASPTNPYGGALASVLFARAEALLSAPSPSEPTREKAQALLDAIAPWIQPHDGTTSHQEARVRRAHADLTLALAAPVPSAAPAREEVTDDMRAKADEHGWGHMNADDAMDTIVSVAALDSCHKVGCEARDKGPFFCDCGFSDAAVSLSNFLRAARPDADGAR